MRACAKLPGHRLMRRVYRLIPDIKVLSRDGVQGEYGEYRNIYGLVI